MAAVRGMLAGTGLAALALTPLLAPAPPARSLALDPLGTAPLVVAAMREPARAAILLTEARRRDPHDTVIRMALMRALAAQGDLPGAAAELAAVRRTAPAAIDTMIAGIARRARDEATITSAAVAFAPHPALLAEFVNGLGGEGDSRQRIAWLLDALPDAALADPAVRDAAVAGLLASGDAPRARAVWAAGRHTGLVTSPDFRRVDRDGPFGWQSGESEVGGIDPAADGLHLTAYGHASGVLLGQTLALPTGRYRLRLSFAPVRGEALFALRLHCNGAAIAGTPLGTASGQSVAVLAFTVDAQACPAQRLEVIATGSETGEAAELRLLGIAVSPS